MPELSIGTIWEIHALLQYYDTLLLWWQINPIYFVEPTQVCYHVK